MKNSIIFMDIDGVINNHLYCKEQEKLPKSENEIGIDLGIKEFAITSDGKLVLLEILIRKPNKL